MTIKAYTVYDAMTACPHCINFSEPLYVARRMMKQHEVRHLPVIEGKRLVGMLSDRDIKLASSIEKGLNVTAGDVCVFDVYTVSPETSLEEALNRMADDAIGSAVVVDKGEIIGILTTVDVCREFAKHLEAHAS